MDLSVPSSRSKRDQPILRIREIQLRTHAHATENINKVKEALKVILSEDYDFKNIQFENLAGSYGNPIRAFSLKLSLKQEIETFLLKLGTKFSPETKEQLKMKFESHLDEKKRFYFRLAKQALAMGNVILAFNSDVVRIVICIQNKNPNIVPTPLEIQTFLESIHLL